jgi:hypothetical protein
MSFLTDKLNSPDVNALQTSIPRKAFVHVWKHLDDDAKAFAKRLTGKEATTNSQTWKLLSASKPETILYTASTSKVSAAVRKINDFLGKWRQVRQRFPLPEMAELRITPELPEYPKIVEEMFLMMLDGKLKSQPEIIKFLTPYSPPLPEPPAQPARRGRGAKKAAAKAPKAAPAAEAAAPAPPAEKTAPEKDKKRAEPVKIKAPEKKVEKRAAAAKSKPAAKAKGKPVGKTKRR